MKLSIINLFFLKYARFKCNFIIAYIKLIMLYLPTVISILEVLAFTTPVLLAVAFITIAEIKTIAGMQRNLGANTRVYTKT